MTWQEAEEPDHKPIGPAGAFRAVLRGVPLAIVVFGGLIVLLLVRLVEWPVFGLNRPITPYITRFVCRTGLRFLGIQFTVHGTPMTEKGAVVCNHASWLDIFSLNACQRIYFVSKSEVANWPGIGWLARSVGTVFVKRDRSDAANQKQVFEDRLKAGHTLLFFPEGTSSDGRQVLPFKSTLFAAFFTDALRDSMFIQPATLTYVAPDGEDARFYGWWGSMDFAPHLIQTLAAKRQGRIELVFHKPLKVSDYADRKRLAADCEAAVRSGLRLEGPSKP